MITKEVIHKRSPLFLFKENCPKKNHSHFNVIAGFINAAFIAW
jgi:hypothetical protein